MNLDEHAFGSDASGHNYDSDDDQDDVQKQIDGLDCQGCGAGISPNTGILAGGWSYRGGTCPNCSFVDAAMVEVDPERITDSQQKKMAREQRNPQAQSCFQAAQFLDRDAPGGRYVIRRVTAYTVQVQLPDRIDQDERIALSDRFKNATKTSGTRTWFVQSFPDRINLVDFQFGTKAEADEPLATTYAGP